jgi:hypothetical protein
MKIKSFYNAVLGITTEVICILAIILAAFLICVAAYFLKR